MILLSIKRHLWRYPYRLTNRWSGRVQDKVPSSYVGVRAAQLDRYVALELISISHR
jgi:hypothetical protein